MSWPRLADLGRLPIPGTDGPAHVRFTPDGSALTYLQAAEAGSLVQSLWLHDLASDERTLLASPLDQQTDDAQLTHRERLDRERRRATALGVTDYAWLSSGPQPVLLVPLGGMAFVGDGATDLRPVAGVSGADAMVGSPDGRHVAFVRDGDLWLAATDDGPARRLTEEADDGVFNGLAEYAAAEELDRFDGVWWSSDSRQIAFAHVDERAVPRFPIAHLGDAAPIHEEHRYPFAGGPNAAVSLRIANVAGGPNLHVPLPLAEGDYLARVVAHPGGGWLAAVLPRAQQSLAWFRVAPDAGVRHAWTESADPWITLDGDTRVLPDGRVLRTTERTGYRHLELRSADGADATQLTAGEWSVTSVAHVDAAGGRVYFHGHADGATEQHLYQVGLTEPAPVTRPERLTPEAGWHAAVFSDDGSRWVDAWSDLDHSTTIVLHETAGVGDGRIIVRPSREAAEMGLEAPELLELEAADATTRLHAALYRPAPGHDDPPPCVVWVYAGPHQQYVKREWTTTVHPLRQYLARAGVAVLVVDGRGSKDRGLAFEAPIHGALGNAEVADQAAALRQLIERGEIDAGRIAITGGSYGGFMTLRAMALEPELFRVGVAVAPVTSWDGYDTAYTERYLGTPEGNPEAYRTSSALEVAHRITGRLLVIHGAIDENVHLRHSLRLVAVMQDLGRDVELVILPADRHKTRTAGGLSTRDRRTVRHLLEGLEVPLPAELTPDQAASGS
jgi:dipeptidyl-peptidase 4